MFLISKLIPITLAVLAGCADPDRYDPMDQKQILVFSGFTVRVADSPTSLERLGRLPQRQLLRYEAGEEPMYVWVDAAGCGCWYTGDPSAYRRLVEMGWEGGQRGQHRPQ
jgi:hypothetical protein